MTNGEFCLHIPKLLSYADYFYSRLLYIDGDSTHTAKLVIIKTPENGLGIIFCFRYKND